MTAGTDSAWSRWQLFGVRISCLITANAMLYFSGVVAGLAFSIPVYLRIAALVAPIGNAETQVMSLVGGVVVNHFGGESASVAKAADLLSFVLGLLVVCVAAAVAWGLADRRRTVYTDLHRYVRVCARYMLALGTLTYAMVKVLPTQFGFLTPGELLQPLGHLSRFWVLWDFMAVSTAYTIFSGLVELTGAAMLFFPTTVIAGALLLGGALTNVLVLDVAYRVPAAATRSALLLFVLDLIVLGPHVPAILDLLRRRARALPDEPRPPVRTWRHTPTAKVTIFLLLVLVHVPMGLAQRRTYGGAGHLVYGIFAVESFTRNGMTVTPLASDGTLWTRVASDGRYDGGSLTIRFANGDLGTYSLADDTSEHFWTIAGLSSSARLHYDVQPDGTVLLDGHVGPDAVVVRLRPFDLTRLPIF